MKNGLSIALAISLVLAAGVAWGSCAVPQHAALDPPGTTTMANL